MQGRGQWEKLPVHSGGQSTPTEHYGHHGGPALLLEVVASGSLITLASEPVSAGGEHGPGLDRRHPRCGTGWACPALPASSLGPGFEAESGCSQTLS